MKKVTNVSQVHLLNPIQDLLLHNDFSEDLTVYFKIQDDTMSPTFKPSQLISCRNKSSLKEIIFGNPYLLNIRGQAITRRIFNSNHENMVLLKADNPFYPDQLVKKDFINHVLEITNPN